MVATIKRPNPKAASKKKQQLSPAHGDGTAAGASALFAPVSEDITGPNGARLVGSVVNPLFLTSREKKPDLNALSPDDMNANLLEILRRDGLPDASTWSILRNHLTQVIESSKELKLELQVRGLCWASWSLLFPCSGLALFVCLTV